MKNLNFLMLFIIMSCSVSAITQNNNTKVTDKNVESLKVLNLTKQVENNIANVIKNKNNLEFLIKKDTKINIADNDDKTIFLKDKKFQVYFTSGSYEELLFKTQFNITSLQKPDFWSKKINFKINFKTTILQYLYDLENEKNLEMELNKIKFNKLPYSLVNLGTVGILTPNFIIKDVKTNTNKGRFQWKPITLYNNRNVASPLKFKIIDEEYCVKQNILLDSSYPIIWNAVDKNYYYGQIMYKIRFYNIFYMCEHNFHKFVPNYSIFWFNINVRLKK